MQTANVQNGEKQTTIVLCNVVDLCPNGWSFIHGECYRNIGQETSDSWENARLACKLHGGDLASVKDEETHQLLLALLAPAVKGWIGGKKIDGKWTWVDGTPFAWTGGWGAGSPSGDGSYMELIGQTYNGWNDLGAVKSDPRDTLCILTAINGNWGAWSTWSECTATCGGGIRTKTRECTDPPPEFNGANCQGLPNKESECNTEECAGTVFILFYLHY